MKEIERAMHEISVQVFRNTDDVQMRISKDCYKAIITCLEEKQQRDNMRCENCIHWLDAHYCGTFDLPFANKPTDFCSYFEPKEKIND